MKQLKILLFGSPQISVGEMKIHLRTRKALALLCFLAVTAKSHSRESVLALLWPESKPSSAKATLRNTLSILRKSIGAQYFIINRHNISLNWQKAIKLDVAEFRQHIEEAESQSNLGSASPLLKAIKLYQGDFLTGFTLADCPDFDEWQFFEMETYRNTFATILQGVIQAYCDIGNFETALPYARQLVALDPMHESAQRGLMVIYAKMDKQRAALRQYKLYTDILAQELGEPPSIEITVLYEAIKQEKRKVGLKTVVLSPPLLPPNNLTVPPTALIDRKTVLSNLSQKLKDTKQRLITIVGPGGVGKTHLVLHLAAQFTSYFTDGLSYVDLSTATDFDTLINTIANALNLALHNNDTPKNQLFTYVKNKHLLLVLDNFEQLLPHTFLLNDLLRFAPKLKLLVTSRQSLDLHGEWLYPLSGLDYPTVDNFKEIATYPAGQLFKRCAKQANPHFSLNKQEVAVGEICEMVDGLPLAIQFAAAWCAIFSPVEIRDGLKNDLNLLSTTAQNIPTRQQSIQTVFESSWQYLSTVEQAILSQLSVFAGSFSYQEAIQTLITLQNISSKKNKGFK